MKQIKWMCHTCGWTWLNNNDENSFHCPACGNQHVSTTE